MKWLGAVMNLLVGIEQEFQNTLRMALAQLRMMTLQKPLYLKLLTWELLNGYPVPEGQNDLFLFIWYLWTTKSKQKPCLKYFKSSEHSITWWDTTLISDCLETHIRVLQQVDQKALDFSFKPSKCVSLLFDGHNHSN